MSRESIYTLIQSLAQEFAFDPATIAGLVEQESGFNPWAIRYEPAFENNERYGPVVRQEATQFVKGRAVSLETEIKARCTSWGLMQVMGQVARELGFASTYLSHLCEPEVGLRVGCKRLSNLWQKTGGEMEKTLLRYNGGGDPDYPRKVMVKAQGYVGLFV